MLYNMNTLTTIVTPNPIDQFDVTCLFRFMLTKNVMDDLTRNTINTDFIRDKRVHVDTAGQRRAAVPSSGVASEEGQSPTSRASEFFFPREKDTLFWCFYIMKNGADVYHHLPHRNIVVEKQMKIEYINQLRENKSLLKSAKTAPLSHVENQLLNEHCIDAKTFNALCVLEGLSCILTFHHCYNEINIETDEVDDIHMITKSSNPDKYGYKTAQADNVHLVRETYYKVDNLAKPIKAMTGYKLDELVVICEKLAIDLDPTYRKRDVYEKIVQHFSV